MRYVTIYSDRRKMSLLWAPNDILRTNMCADFIWELQRFDISKVTNNHKKGNFPIPLTPSRSTSVIVNSHILIVLIIPGRYYNNLLPADPCASQPCHYGATCVNSEDGYQCICMNGFHGLQCDFGKKNNLIKLIENYCSTPKRLYGCIFRL